VKFRSGPGKVAESGLQGIDRRQEMTAG